MKGHAPHSGRGKAGSRDTGRKTGRGVFAPREKIARAVCGMVARARGPCLLNIGYRLSVHGMDLYEPQSPYTERSRSCTQAMQVPPSEIRSTRWRAFEITSRNSAHPCASCGRCDRRHQHQRITLEPHEVLLQPVAPDHYLLDGCEHRLLAQLAVLQDLLDQHVHLAALRVACEQPEVLRDHAARGLDALGRGGGGGRLLPLERPLERVDCRPAR